MKILKLLSNSAVIFADDSLRLNGQRARGDDWVSPSYNTGNAVLDDAVLPPGFIGNAWSYIGTTWAVLPGSQPAVDAELARLSDLLVPPQVDMEQLRGTLSTTELASIVAAFALLVDPQKTRMQTKWEYSAFVKRQSLLTNQVRLALGKTNKQMDTLFIAAALL